MKNLFTLPNILTLAGLSCGCAAIVFAITGGVADSEMYGNLAAAFWLTCAAAVFDFADGLAARFTGQYSKIGIQLDSLADMVSFGVAPSVILLAMYRTSPALYGGTPAISDRIGWLVFAVALFSALRLAKFNVDEEQKSEFTGLPTPAAALAVAALGAMAYLGEITLPREMILALAAIVCWLLVCPIRMFSLKFKTWGWRDNWLRYIFLAISAILIAVFKTGGITIAVALYVVVSTVRYFFYRKRS